MTGERVTRRLAAILAADVAGYSRLMGRDENGTLTRLKAHRTERLEPTLARHGGRLVKLTGDGALVEFPSAVDALGAAIEFQQAMAEANAGQPEDTAIVFRIGLHLGDLIVDGDDLYGDGVNVAARLEAEAPPGGIVISYSVRDAVAGRLKATFDDLGNLTLKNIERPVRVFRVEWEPADWKVSAQAADGSLNVATELAADTPLVLPDKPSIAVLPFQNMSGDPEQEYFADGVVEDIITALSRIKWLFVIARNSTFTYKGQAVDVRRVGRELGVRYVLEGSLRKAGSRVRITCQLINAATARHVWADRFEGLLEDVFALQDEITSRVVAALEPSLRTAEIQRTSVVPTKNLTAYDLCLRAAQGLRVGRESRRRNDEALQLLKAALVLDPGYSWAAAEAALAYMNRRLQGWSTPEEEGEGIRLAELALRDHRDDPTTLACAGHALLILGRRHEEALKAADLAIALAPDLWRVVVSCGWICLFNEDADAAVRNFERALRLSPLDPGTSVVFGGIGYSHWLAGRHELGLEAARRAVGGGPAWVTAHRVLVLCLAALGRLDEAREAARRMLSLAPAYRVGMDGSTPFRTPQTSRRFVDMLRAAGLPE